MNAGLAWRFEGIGSAEVVYTTLTAVVEIAERTVLCP